MFNKLIKESTEAFGKEHQCITLYEELSELEQAICKMLRFGWQGDDEQHIKIRDNFIEEMVDVINLYEWFLEEVMHLTLEEVKKSIQEENLRKEFKESETDKKILNSLIFFISEFKIDIAHTMDESSLEWKYDKEESLRWCCIVLKYLLSFIEDDREDSFTKDVTMNKLQKWADYKHERNLKRIEEAIKK